MTEYAHEATPPPQEPTRETESWGTGVPPPPERQVEPQAEKVKAVPVQPGEIRGPTIEVRTQASTAPAPPEHAPRSEPAAPPPGAAGSTTPPPVGATPTAPPPPQGPPPQGPPPQGPGAAAAHALPASQSRVWVVLCHLAYLLPAHVPGILVTTALWMWKRKQDPFLAEQGREALNMQLTFWLVNLVLTALVVTAPLAVFVWVVGAILCILATLRVADGESHRYPWILRIIA